MAGGPGTRAARAAPRQRGPHEAPGAHETQGASLASQRVASAPPASPDSPNPAGALRRLRSFLFGTCAVLFVATLAELVLEGHFEDPFQLVPFVLCGAGLVALAAAWARPSRGTVRALRLVMAAVLVGSAVGVFQHAAGNLGFGLETQPDAGAGRLLVAVLTGGNPLLAPGILALAAALAVAAAATTPDGTPL